MKNIDCLLNNMALTHTSGTSSNENFLDNKPNRDEPCFDSYENYIIITWGKWYTLANS